MLDDANVALGVSGSIAAVRCVELVHELRRRGAAVRVVMSDAARSIVHPWSLEFASGSPVVTGITGAVEHVELCGNDGWADVLLLAPATANTVGKVAAGIDDTPVTTVATTAIGAGIPLVVAPAMHEPMYDHPRVAANLEGLESDYGATVVPPRLEEGKAKIAEHERIALAVARAVPPSPLAGRTVAVASGATAEPVDPIRVLTTRASGKTGRAVAKALYALGASVRLLHADAAEVGYAAVDHVETAADLEDAALAAVEDGIDAFVAAAAVGDFAPESSAEKIPSGSPITLELAPTPKVIASVRSAAPDLPIVGFKAEVDGDDDRLVERARELLRRHDLAFVVANDASVMGREETRVLVVHPDAVEEVTGPKTAVGVAIADALVETLERAEGTK